MTDSEWVSSQLDDDELEALGTLEPETRTRPTNWTLATGSRYADRLHRWNIANTDAASPLLLRSDYQGPTHDKSELGYTLPEAKRPQEPATALRLDEDLEPDMSKRNRSPLETLAFMDPSWPSQADTSSQQAAASSPAKPSSWSTSAWKPVASTSDTALQAGAPSGKTHPPRPRLRAPSGTSAAANGPDAWLTAARGQASPSALRHRLGGRPVVSEANSGSIKVCKRTLNGRDTRMDLLPRIHSPFPCHNITLPGREAGVEVNLPLTSPSSTTATLAQQNEEQVRMKCIIAGPTAATA